MEEFLPDHITRMIEDASELDAPFLNRYSAASSFPLNAAASPFRPAFLQGTIRRLPRAPRPALSPGGWLSVSPPETPPAMTAGDLPAPAYQTPNAPPSAEPRRSDELTRFVTPSGPRRNGEGTQEAAQRIERILVLHDEGILVQTTLLVAGFILGPSGDSVRKIGDVSGACVSSCTEFIRGKECRVFFVEGTMPCMLHAIDIMKKAVNRYKDLAEGKFRGCQVDRIHIIDDVDFYYHPPPRGLVPDAASLCTNRPNRPDRPDRSGRGSGEFRA